jgi:uncharacterized Zn-binding protein involved in type VI secretion
MAERALVRQGDKTTHGGTVISGDPTMLVHGRPVARVGDFVTCSQCKKTGRIVTGAATLFDGPPVALHDDLTDCGAKLIASQVTDVYGDDDGGESAAATPTMVPESQLGNEAPRAPEALEMGSANESDINEEPYTIRFQAIDSETNTPIAKCVYILTRENGTQHGGLTDRQGFTETVETAQKEQIAVHFSFKSSTGTFIDREDLT